MALTEIMSEEISRIQLHWLASLYKEEPLEAYPVFLNPITTTYSDKGIVDAQYRINQSQSFAINIERTLDYLRNISVIISNPNEIRNYLFNNLGVEDLIVSICQATMEEFKDRAKLYLDIYKDPEIKDKYLTLYVRQEHYDDDIIEVIESISEQYEDDIKEQSIWFLITTDFSSTK